jgi:polar amino acid transport system substrate-binding protein
MINFRYIFLFFLIVLNLNAKDLEKVSIQLDWLHQFQFAGYYIAKEKGFYKDEGLDVDIKEFNFNVDLVNDVLTKKSDYAVGKSSLIIDRLQNRKIILLAAIYQDSPMVLLSLKNSNIQTPKNLKDKKVMLTSDAISAAAINSMIISQGIKLSQINFIPHSFKLEDLINGTTDAMGCYLSNEPYILKQKGIEFNILNPSDFGFDFYGGIFFTSEEELTKYPLRVKKMYKATLKGWQYAFKNINETSKLIYNKYNTQNKSLESLIYEGKILKKLSKIDQGLLGNLNLNKLEEIKRLFLLLGVSKNYQDLNINDIIYNPLKINFTTEEKKFLENTDIKLYTNTDFPPFTMKDNNSIKGMEIDYWKLINEKLKKEPQFEIINENKTLTQKVKENKNNVKFAFANYDLDKKLQTTDSITKINIAIATLNNKPFISSPQELEGRNVGISKFADYYQNLKNKYPNINFVEVKNIKENLEYLLKGKIYASIDKLPALSYHITQNSLTNIKISGTIGEPSNIKLLVNSDNTLLLNILNKVITSISQDDISMINNKYYSVIYQTSIDYSWIYKVVIPLIIIILIIIITNRRLKVEIKKRKIIEQELHKIVNTDVLTNIYNRRKIESLINLEIEHSNKYAKDLSIIFFDIDDFKEINDTYGHKIGDKILIDLSKVVSSTIRKNDHFGRWGGEEFIVILPNTDIKKAKEIAEKIKNTIYSYDFEINKNISCSFGVTQVQSNDNEDSIITRVDNAMYEVKEDGKNSVKVV